MKKTKTAFILYEFDEFENDFQYIAEYYNEKELQEKQLKGLSIRTIQRHIQREIQDGINNLIDNKYLIIKEKVSI